MLICLVLRRWVKNFSTILEKYVDKNFQWTQEDLNALMYAAYHNHVQVANVLIENNCDLDSTDYVI